MIRVPKFLIDKRNTFCKYFQPSFNQPWVFSVISVAVDGLVLMIVVEIPMAKL